MNYSPNPTATEFSKIETHSNPQINMALQPCLFLETQKRLSVHHHGPVLWRRNTATAKTLKCGNITLDPHLPMSSIRFMCVQGFNQKFGIDYFETYTPTGKTTSLRALLLFALDKNLPMLQLEVKGAFLHAKIDEEVYIRRPKGSSRKLPILKLEKSLYGLKQAPRNW